MYMYRCQYDHHVSEHVLSFYLMITAWPELIDINNKYIYMLTFRDCFLRYLSLGVRPLFL